MPGLILQPLVENAVYHGIGQLAGGGTINISVQSRAGSIVVVVENPAPETPQDSGGHHMALENIRQRLHVLYGTRCELQLVPAKRHFRVELSYPLREPE